VEVVTNGSTYLHLVFESLHNTYQSSVFPIASESSADVGFAGLHLMSKNFPDHSENLRSHISAVVSM
jgi:hypothetical protein